MEQTKAKRAAVYCRLSKASSDEQAISGLDTLGVDRQEADARELCSRLGWEIAEVYVDNDLSAWSGAKRPGYEKMISDLVAGRRDAVVVWHLDRLYRRVLDLETFLAAVDKAGVERNLATCYGDYDLSTADGRFQLRILVSVAQKESDDKSRRLRRKHEEIAKAGKPWGGGPPPFGYEREGRNFVVVPAQRALVLQAADRVLSGESLNRVAGDLGFRSPHVLKRILTGPSVAGYREYDGTLYKATWEPVLDLDRWERLRLVLRDPARRSRSKTKTLLAGLLRCGECGERMLSDGVNGYVCKSPRKLAGQTGCGKCWIRREGADSVVWDAALDYLESPANLSKLVALWRGDDEPDGVLEAIQGEEARLQTLRERLADGVLDVEDFTVAKERISKRLADLRARVGTGTVPGVLEGFSVGAARDWPVEKRRALLDAWLVMISCRRGRGAPEDRLLLHDRLTQ